MLKKSLFFSIMLLILFSVSISAKATTVNTYKDSVTGVSFNLPSGWKETPLNEDREYIQVKYQPENNDGASIQFGYVDVWGQLPDSDKVGYSRSDMTHTAMTESLTKDEMLEALGFGNLGAEIDSVHYNNIEYLEITVETEMEIFEVSADIIMTILMHIDNGYAYQFVYGDLAEKSHYQEFATMMNSVKYPYATKADNGIVSIDSNGDLQFDFFTLIVSLIFTIAVYSLPILIYRYGIKKQALPEKKAKKITIIYGIIAFFVMAILLGGAPGGAILLWSFVNYKVLTTSNKNDIGLKYKIITEEITKDEDTVEESVESLETPPQENEIFEDGFKIKSVDEVKPENNPEVLIKKAENDFETPISEKENIKPQNFTKVLFCRKCGTKLLEDSDFCHKCGLRVIREDVK